MTFDVTFKRMGSKMPQHLLHICSSVETAIQLTREQYPGSLIISVLLVD